MQCLNTAKFHSSDLHRIRQVPKYQIFQTIRQYRCWSKILTICCCCSCCWALHLIRGVFHLDISFSCWFKGHWGIPLSFLGTSQLKKLMEMETRGQEVPQQLMYRRSWRLFEHVRWICLFHWWSFFLVISRTSSLGIIPSPWQIISCWIKGILVYLIRM